MNKRKFFGALGKAVLGCYLALGVKDFVKADENEKWILNPEWVSAPLEFENQIFYFYPSFTDFILEQEKAKCL
jgi:hypothetical protein